MLPSMVGQRLHQWSVVFCISVMVRAFGLTVVLPVATAASVDSVHQPLHFPQAAALASCMANCASKLDLKHPSDDSCSKNSICHSCVRMCGLLVRDPDARGSTCGDDRCVRGCEIACEHTLSQHIRSNTPSHNNLWSFPKKPSLSLSGRTMLRLSWTKPRPRTDRHEKKPLPLVAYVLMYKDNKGEWASFYATFDTKVTAPLPRMTADFRLIAVTDTGVASSIIINFKDSPNDDNLDMVTEDESSGEVPEWFSVSKPQPPPGIFHSIHTHVRHSDSGRFEIVVTWQQELRPGLERAEYDVAWTRAVCHDKVSSLACPPSDKQFNFVVPASTHKRMHVTLEGLHFNSRYDLEIGFSNFPRQRLALRTPHCRHPDATYQKCIKTHPTPTTTTSTTTTTTSATSSVSYTTVTEPRNTRQNDDVTVVLPGPVKDTHLYEHHSDLAQVDPMGAQENVVDQVHKGEALPQRSDNQPHRRTVILAISLSAALGAVALCCAVAIFVIHRRYRKNSFDVNTSSLWASIPQTLPRFQTLPGSGACYNLKEINAFLKQSSSAGDNGRDEGTARSPAHMWTSLTQGGDVEHKTSDAGNNQPMCGHMGGHQRSGHTPCSSRMLSSALPGSLQLQPITPSTTDNCCIGKTNFQRQNPSQNSFKKTFISPRPNIDILKTSEPEVIEYQRSSSQFLQGDNDLRYHLVSVSSSDTEELDNSDLKDPFASSQSDLDSSFSSDLSKEGDESFLYWISGGHGRLRKGGSSDYHAVAQQEEDGEKTEEVEEKHTRESEVFLSTFSSQVRVIPRSSSNHTVRKSPKKNKRTFSV